MLRPPCILLVLASCASTPPLPLHPDAPGSAPELFAPGAVSTDDSIELNGVISPDGREFFFSRRVGDTWAAATGGTVFWVDPGVLSGSGS